MKTIAINAGFSQIKVATAKDVYCFPSRLKKLSQKQDSNHLLKVGDSLFEIGSGAKNIDNKLTNLTNKYCTYYAIGSHTQDNEHINLLLTLPLKDFLDKQFRAQYITYLLGDSHCITLSVNEHPLKTIYIDHASVKPEAVVAVMNNMDYFSNKLIGVLDIGGGTINGAIFDNGQIIPDSIIPLDNGIYRLEQSVIDTLNMHLHSNIQDYELKYIFSSSNNLISQDSYQTLVKPLIDEYIFSLRQRLLQKSWNLEILPLFITGGGALFCQESLLEIFPLAKISDDPVFDNVKGLWKLSQVTTNV